MKGTKPEGQRIKVQLDEESRGMLDDAVRQTLIELTEAGNPSRVLNHYSSIRGKLIVTPPDEEVVFTRKQFGNAVAALGVQSRWYGPKYQELYQRLRKQVK